MMASSSFLSNRQEQSLKALVNALLPPLLSNTTGEECCYSDDDEREFYSYDLTKDHVFLKALQDTIETKLSRMERRKLVLLLSLLSTTIGTFAVFQIPSYHCFIEWTVTEQTIALQESWQHSAFALKREIFSSLKRLICGLAFSHVDNDHKRNPFWKAMNYPGPPPFIKNQTNENVLDSGAFIDVTTTTTTTLEYDIVVVGSGAGGGVAAAQLAQAGYSVVVVEKSSYVAPSQLTNCECVAFDLMYEKHSLLTTSDGNIMILAGSTLGGGTTVNWACCLELPSYVKDEWIQDHGLRQLLDSPQYDESLQAIKKRIGYHSPESHNVVNSKMIQGCNVLGYKCESTGQNLRNDSDPNAGYTCFGDANNKQGGVVTYLADAVRNGAKIIQNAKVHRIITYLSEEDGRKRAVGIVAEVLNGSKVEIKARKCVICSAGSLNTPCLLQRSGLRNPHIGRHLHLHPVTAAVGFFDDESIHCYLGAPMTTVCNQFAPQAKLECPSAHTGLLAAGLPYRSARDFKKTMLRLAHVSPFIVLQRDTVSEGRVRLGDDGLSPVIDYELKEADKRSMMTALKGAFKILIASGANEVMSGHNDDPGLSLANDEKYVSAESIDGSAKIQEYLESIDKTGMKAHEIGIFSAHQMSSCRMGISSQESVVDENGEAWECDDLYIMDASIFPTASGANPMLTTLTLSHMLSTRLVERLNNNLETSNTGDKRGVEAWMNERKRKRARQPRYGYSALLLWPWVLATGVVALAVAVKYWK